jgi:hypothetical protein
MICRIFFVRLKPFAPGRQIHTFPIYCNAHTEQGIAMLSSILNSDRAIIVNIQIIWVFTRVRQFLYDNTDLRNESIILKPNG